MRRITAAARELFTAHGVEEVTTKQIADRADVATGTLFLYAKNKPELLLMVHNIKYAEALEKGIIATRSSTDQLDQVMAIIEPIVTCNRIQIDNGRTYLREVVFGDPTQPHHSEALRLTAMTEAAIADVLRRDNKHEADTLAHIILAIIFISITITANAVLDDESVIAEIHGQIRVLLS